MRGVRVLEQRKCSPTRGIDTSQTAVEFARTVRPRGENNDATMGTVKAGRKRGWGHCTNNVWGGSVNEIGMGLNDDDEEWGCSKSKYLII